VAERVCVFAVARLLTVIERDRFSFSAKHFLWRTRLQACRSRGSRACLSSNVTEGRGAPRRPSIAHGGTSPATTRALRATRAHARSALGHAGSARFRNSAPRRF